MKWIIKRIEYYKNLQLVLMLFKPEIVVTHVPTKVLFVVDSVTPYKCGEDVLTIAVLRSVEHEFILPVMLNALTYEEWEKQ